MDTCKVLYLGRYYGVQPRDWWLETLSRIDNPVTQEYRHKATVCFNLQISEWSESLIKMFDDQTYVDLDFAEYFDNRYAENNLDAALASPKVRPRAKEWAKQRLEYDPYKITAIGVLSSEMKSQRASDGGVVPKYDRTSD